MRRKIFYSLVKLSQRKAARTRPIRYTYDCPSDENLDANVKETSATENLCVGSGARCGDGYLGGAGIDARACHSAGSAGGTETESGLAYSARPVAETDSRESGSCDR